jgi:hypothetical protein
MKGGFYMRNLKNGIFRILIKLIGYLLFFLLLFPLFSSTQTNSFLAFTPNSFVSSRQKADYLISAEINEDITVNRSKVLEEKAFSMADATLVSKDFPEILNYNALKLKERIERGETGDFYRKKVKESTQAFNYQYAIIPETIRARESGKRKRKFLNENFSSMTY